MKRFYVFIIFLYFAYPLFACDLCGCSSGGYFIGPYPQFSGYFAGLQYSFRDFSTVLNSDNNQFSRDLYQTAELIGGTRLGTRWQVLIYFPFNINRAVSDDGTNDALGIGDLSFFANYKLLNNKKLNAHDQTVSQQLLIGGGMKFPTGKFSVDTAEIVSSANLQPGTGSIDYLIDAIYSFQVRSWGLNVNASYKLNGLADHFKFGDRFSTTAFLFHSFHMGNITASPNAGLLYDHIWSNEHYGEKVSQTGGNDLLSALGIEIQIMRVTVGCNAQLPLASDLSAGQTHSKLQGMMHLSYSF